MGRAAEADADGRTGEDRSDVDGFLDGSPRVVEMGKRATALAFEAGRSVVYAWRI